MSSDTLRQDQARADLRATQHRIDLDNARRSQDFQDRMAAPPSSTPPPARDPFDIPGGLQRPAP